ncbi:MAG: HAD-IA family hydrolase [Anaerolineales bacterium]|jgi:HAD superfamily hydrolase (TIGR01509 family)
MIRALIFDFDGLILETEGPSYKSWEEVYQSFGFALPFSTWSTIIGTTQGEFDPCLELKKKVKGRVDWEGIESRRRASEKALIEAQSVMPGVEQYLKDARRLGLKTGLASSSSCKWVIGHLTRLGLVDYFDCICASDDVEHTKPDPELYLSVLRELDVSAEEAIALEDSPIGIQAAKQAGLFCVAVPNPLTRQLSLSQADFQLGSLAEMLLEQLLNKVVAD